MAEADIAVPRTPTPGSKGSRAAFNSPLPLSDLTPPPSTQPAKLPGAQFLGDTSSQRRGSLASPPATTKPTPLGFQGSWSWNGTVPTLEESRNLPEPQLRELVNHIIPALGETRMQLAHTRLQLNLLSIETAEAAQRAEAEHDLTRREVEVLQAESPTLRSRSALFPDPRSALAQVQRHLESSIKQGRELESENYQLGQRLKQAKRVIQHLHTRNSELVEINRLLRERIRENREHFNEARASSFSQLKVAPKANSQPPSGQRKSDQPGLSRSKNQTPLDALLMADQILSAEPSSLPATPTPYRASKYNHGHSRGTLSLSSLPSTPTRPTRPLTADELLRTPVNQIIPTSFTAHSAPISQLPPVSRDRSREDRDSTISADEDLAMTDEDIPASQASQAASSMLRRGFPGLSSQDSPTKGKQDRLVQSKLMGKVTKNVSAPEKEANHEHGSDHGANGGPRKRVRLEKNKKEHHGLGIGGI